MKDLIRSILLIVAIYSGATDANPHDGSNIPMAVLCGVVCAIFVSIKDDKKH